MRKKHLEPVHGRGQHNFNEINKKLPGYAYIPRLKNGETIAPEISQRPRMAVWKKILLALVGLALVFGAWFGWKIVSNEVRVFGWRGVINLLLPAKLKGESSGHVNILLAGNSADDPGHQGAELTDSIMVVSINTNNKSAFMISVPRDLYVDIPGFDYAKINEVYQDGQTSNFSGGGYPNGGMGLLEKVVSDKLGIPIHYYALVDYAALRDAVNAVGGIQFNVQSSDPRGLYDPSIDWSNGGPMVKLTNGVHTLGGQQALNLARARGDAYGSYGFGMADFDRTKNQRQIMLALKDKAGNAGTLTNPFKMAKLFDSFGKNVKTDLSAGQARRLYNLMKKIPSNKIVSAGLNDADGKNLLASYTTRYGQSALVPAAGLDDYSAIQTYLQKLLGQ